MEFARERDIRAEIQMLREENKPQTSGFLSIECRHDTLLWFDCAMLPTP